MRIGFLASHNGSAMCAILRAIAAKELDAKPVLTISNNEGAPALAAARTAGVRALVLNARLCGSPAACDAAMASALVAHRAELVLLSGFMRPLGPEVLARYRNRVLNVHPALLPKFGGKGMYGAYVHQAVVAAREHESGATIHLVDGEYDHGPIVAQRRIGVGQGETPEALALRIRKLEAGLVVDTIRAVVERRIDLDAIAAAASGPVDAPRGRA